jgi:hypothetical protein
MQHHATLPTPESAPAQRASQSEPPIRWVAGSTRHPNEAVKVNKVQIFTSHIVSCFAFFARFKANRTAVLLSCATIFSELALGHVIFLKKNDLPFYQPGTKISF